MRLVAVQAKWEACMKEFSAARAFRIGRCDGFWQLSSKLAVPKQKGHPLRGGRVPLGCAPENARPLA